MIRRRTDPDSLVCIYCGQRFTSWRELGPHERDHYRAEFPPPSTDTKGIQHEQD